MDAFSYQYPSYTYIFTKRASKDGILRGLSPPSRGDSTRRIVTLATLLNLAPNLKKHFVSDEKEIFEKLNRIKLSNNNWQSFFKVDKYTEFLIVPSRDNMYKGRSLHKVEYVIGLKSTDKLDVPPPRQQFPVALQPTILLTKDSHCIFKICYDVTSRLWVWGHFDYCLWRDFHTILAENSSLSPLALVKINEAKLDAQELRHRARGR